MEGVPALLDLSTVAETERAATWSGAALSLFPGLSVDHTVATPMFGQIRHVWMGGGSLWSIQSPPAVVSYVPLAGAAGAHPSFTLMMQWKGRTTVDQNWRHCSLGAGDICLLDERIPFRLEGHEACEIVFLRMPRQLVLGRNPHLEHHTASTLHAAEAGAALLGATLSSMLATVPYMHEERRFAALSAIIHLLGAAETTPRETGDGLHWRVQAALDFIELNFALPGLNAEQVAQAQQISRRRLDQLLRETMGVSITARIWNRRLEQSAADLRDPLRTGLTASRIAFANGFEDAAHFTRAFKRRYGQAPAQWRQGKTATH
jgi:AraC-like DNA-binding protein